MGTGPPIRLNRRGKKVKNGKGRHPEKQSLKIRKITEKELSGIKSFTKGGEKHEKLEKKMISENGSPFPGPCFGNRGAGSQIRAKMKKRAREGSEP